MNGLWAYSEKSQEARKTFTSDCPATTASGRENCSLIGTVIGRPRNKSSRMLTGQGASSISFSILRSSWSLFVGLKICS